MQLHPRFLALLDNTSFVEDRDARDRLGRPGVDAHGVAMLERTADVAQHPEPRADDGRRGDRARVREHHSSVDGLLLDAGEVRRDARAGPCGVDGPTVRLQTADPAAQAARHQLDLFAHAQRSVDQPPGHDRAEARHRERSVDGQAGSRQIAPRRCGAEDRLQRREELLEPSPRRRGDVDDRSVGERRARERGADLRADEGRPLVVDEIALAEDDHASLDAEQLEDREVLPGLGHDALIRGHDEHDRVDTADAGEHVADEVLMARHVDDAHVRAAGKREPGEAQVDGHPALAFFAQAVGVDAGERVNERGLAVVDVAGRSDDADRRVAAHGPGPPVGAHGVQVAKSAGTTTNARTTRPVIQSARTIEVARSGSGELGFSRSPGPRRTRSPP